MLRCQVQKPWRGHIINAQQVGPERPDLLKIPERLLAGTKGVPSRVWSKWAIGDPFDVPFACSQSEKLAIDSNAGGSVFPNAPACGNRQFCWLGNVHARCPIILFER